jgi:hypothetical protein
VIEEKCKGTPLHFVDIEKREWSWKFQHGPIKEILNFSIHCPFLDGIAPFPRGALNPVV